MLIADGGGGGTTWNSMSMDEMQRLIQNPDIEKHYDLVSGWQKSAELVNSHRFQVQSYRDNLAAAWPPKKSAASAAYLLRLDELIGHLTETYNAALANHDALAAATLSLSLAQHDVQKLYDEYQANQTLLQTFEAKKQEAAGPTPHPTPNPGGDEPPVAAGRQEELRQRAAVLLGGVSTDLAQAQMSLVRPTPYAPARGIEETEPNGGGGLTAPPLPLIGSSSASRGRQGVSTDGSSTILPSSNNAPPSPGTPSSPLPPQQPGLVLGGISSPVTNPQTPGVPTSSPALPNGVESGQAANPGLLPPASPGLSPNIGVPVPPSGLGRDSRVPGDGSGRAGASSGFGEVRALPAGGIIGGPGIGIGQPVASRPAPRRINPVGGVIGERGSTIRGLAGEPASSYGVPYGQLNKRVGDRLNQGEGSHWDPNNPWETAKGVAPVVLPPPEKSIDPGPAIGLD